MAYKCKLCGTELPGEYYSLVNLGTEKQIPIRYCVDCFPKRLEKKGSQILTTCLCGKNIDISRPGVYNYSGKNLICEDCLKNFTVKEKPEKPEKATKSESSKRTSGSVKCFFCGNQVSNDIRVNWQGKWYHPGCKNLEIEKRQNRSVICHYCGEQVLVRERICENNYSYHPKCFEEYQRKKETRSVKCHMCGEQVLVSERVADDQGFWYHPNCLIQQQKRNELLGYICMLFGLKAVGPVVYSQLKRATQGFGYTYDGILKALKYFYEVKHGDKEKANESIGIVFYVYDEAQTYYNFIKAKQNQIVKDIEPTLHPPKIEVHVQTDAPRPAKEKYSFDDLLNDDLF